MNVAYLVHVSVAFGISVQVLGEQTAQHRKEE